MAACPPFTAAAFFFLLVLHQLLASAIADAGEAVALLRRASVADDPRGALTSWASGADANSTAPCLWAGVSCGPPTDGRAVAVNLSGMRLASELRLDELLALPALQFLDLRSNAFYGNLSHVPSLPCALVVVDISSNAFNATLPPAFLASCAALQFLNLSRNSLAGFPIAPSLRSLDLSRNNLVDAGLLNYLHLYMRSRARRSRVAP